MSRPRVRRQVVHRGSPYCGIANHNPVDAQEVYVSRVLKLANMEYMDVEQGHPQKWLDDEKSTMEELDTTRIRMV